MLNLFKNLFGSGDSEKMQEAIKNGAVIIDVRSPVEFKGGHVKNSINIPLEQIPQNIKKIKDFNKPIVVCCASGMRSSRAKSILKEYGISEVFNGGSWMSLS